MTEIRKKKKNNQKCYKTGIQLLAQADQHNPTQDKEKSGKGKSKIFRKTGLHNLRQ